jgi:hypothetical protein
MKEGIRGWAPFLTLLTLAVAAGVAWRMEVEWRFGWPGLLWTTGHYGIVPVAVALFIAWVVWVTPVRNRPGFIGVLVVYALPATLVADLALHAEFGRFGPSSLLALMVWLMIPLSFCLICRLFGAPITALRVVGAAVLFAASWPVAAFVRGFFEDRGGSDFIHALKSGFVIPFLVISLGLPLLALPRRKPSDSCEMASGQVS